MKPIIKWQGGKTQLLKELNALKPTEYNSYFEPFLGGGAFLLELRPAVACVNDYNTELINLYQVIADETKLRKLERRLDLMQKKIDKLPTKENKRPYYNKIRELDRNTNYTDIKDYNRAARFIFLNKLGFNGRYRENKHGYFNIPVGNYKKVKLYNRKDLGKVHDYFEDNIVQFNSGDFIQILRKAKPGDFVYIDPPYDPIVETELSYTKKGFHMKDQIRLANEVYRLTKRGVKVMLSNHNTDLIQDLYEEYDITVVLASRTINVNGAGRGPVEEVIVRNYDNDGNMIELKERKYL